MKMPMSLRRDLPSVTLLISTLAFTAFTACRSSEHDNTEEPAGPTRISWPSTDTEGLPDGEIAPLELRNTNFLGSGRFNSVFWLDFEGATVTSAGSFIVENAGLKEVVIPPLSAADVGSQTALADLKLQVVQELLPLFPDVDIRLTTTKPLSGPFSRVHIGGKNFTGKPLVLGIAPLDLGNRSGEDVLFIFASELRNIRASNTARTHLVHAIAHEIGHALGARHIDNDLALMKPSVSVAADLFNETGPVVGSPSETENSLQILKNSAGSRTVALAEQAPPKIVDLAAFATDHIIQYTVITQRNINENPGIKLADYRYQWTFEGKVSEGTSVMMTFSDRNDHILNLNVLDKVGTSRKFVFSVGRRR